MRALSGRPQIWISVALGIAVILVGFSLVLKPFSSLRALILFVAAGLIVAGAGELISDRPARHSWLSLAAGPSGRV